MEKDWDGQAALRDRARDHSLMALAGELAFRRPRNGFAAFAIITAEPSELCAELHKPHAGGPQTRVLARLAWRGSRRLVELRPCSRRSVRGMICWPVSARVGNVKNNDPGLIEPIAA